MAEPGLETSLLVPSPSSSHDINLLRQLPEVGPNSSNNCLTLEASAVPLEMYLEGQDYAGFLKSLGWGEGSTFHFHGHRASAVLLQSHYVCVRARGSQRQRQTTAWTWHDLFILPPARCGCTHTHTPPLPPLPSNPGRKLP